MSPHGYALLTHGAMISDPSRATGYAPALRDCVKPGSIVVDIGAGTGFFSLLACQLGAKHVYAIESDSVTELARQVARDCGFESRITFIKDISTNVTLPERADVVVSDIRGVLPLFQNHIPAIVDARQRLLKPGGKLLPAADRLWVSLVASPAMARNYSNPWQANDYGLDFSACRSIVSNTWSRVQLKPEDVKFKPHNWAVLDYSTVASPNVTGTVQWTSASNETVDGVAIWFDAEVGSGHRYSNAPGEAELIYGQAYFPLEQPLNVEAGDGVEVRLAASLVEGAYVWSWLTRVTRNNEVVISFDQSTFYAAQLSSEDLKPGNPSFVPADDQDVKIAMVILQLVNGERSLEDMGKQLVQDFPDVFARPADAMRRAGQVIARVGRHEK